jgi:DNA polymerase-3 subunit beta
MKLTCLQENLNRGLSIVSHIASKNTSLPILNNVLIKAEGGTISLITTNLEMGIQCRVRGKVEKEGSYTVQSKLLADYVNLLSRDSVQIELLDLDVMGIQCAKSHTKIKGNSAEEFPLIPEIAQTGGFSIPAQDLITALSQVLFATSLSETRPEISGVYFNFLGNELTLAATDSYRLAEKIITIENKGGEEKEAIIPSRTLQELYRILSGMHTAEDVEDSSVNTVQIFFEDNQVLFTFGGIELVSRIIEGQYPNYKQIIPTNHITRVVVSVSALIKAVKTASLFSKTGMFDVTLEFKNGAVTVSSTNNQLGENTSSVEGRMEGEENNIVVNYRYMLDGLQNLQATDVILEMTDQGNPCVLKPAESLEDNKQAVETGNYLYIVMPIKQ